MMELKDSTPSFRAAHTFQSRSDSYQTDRNRVGYTYAFHLIRSGSGELVLPQNRYPIRAGTLLYIPPLTRHSILSDPDHPLFSYNMYCDIWDTRDTTSFPHIVWDRTPVEAYITRMVSCPTLDEFPTVSSLRTIPFLSELFVHLVQLAERTSMPNQQTVIQGMLTGWMLEASYHLQSKEPSDYRIVKVVELIESMGGAENYDLWLRKSGLSKSQFYRQFKMTTGLTPKAFVLKVKMKQAAMALVESNTSITAIAESLGYSTVHYFTNQFTRHFGESPSTYRKNGVYRII